MSKIKAGDRVTFEGFGVGRRGQRIEHGRSVDTGRKAKCVTLSTFVVAGRPAPTKMKVTPT